MPPPTADPWDELQADLRAELRPIYLLTGQEPFLLRRAQELLWRAARAGGPKGFNEQIFHGDSAKGDAIVSACNTLPMMAKRRAVLVRSVNRMKKEELEILGAYATRPAPTTVLILVTDDDPDKKLDGRGKLPVAARKSGRAFEWKRLYGARLRDWVGKEAEAQGKRLDPRGADYAIARLGGELSHLSNAVQLAAIYVGEAPEIKEGDIGQVLSGDRQDALWDFIDAFGERAAERAPGLLAEVLQQGEEPLAILQLLRKRAKELSRARLAHEGGANARDALSAAGVSPAIAWRLEKQVTAWKSAEWTTVLARLLKAESDIKGGARIDPRWSLERAVLSLLRPGSTGR